MLEKKELNQEELDKVSGGNEEPYDYADIKCIIEYLYQGQKLTTIVELKLKYIENETSKSDIEDAVKNWCNEHSYEYIRYQMLSDSSYFVV